MRYDDIDSSLTRSLRRQVGIALVIGAVLVGGAGGVAALAEISGAVTGAGKLIVEGRAKQVQHLDGGTVRDIYVHEGDTVEAGQVLFALDPTVVEANLEIVRSRIAVLSAQAARLDAERRDAETIVFPDGLSDVLTESQRDLMETRRVSRTARHAQLGARIAQSHEKIVALDAQKAATAESAVLALEEVESRQALSDSALLRATDLRTAKRALVDLRAEAAALDAQIVEVREAILDLELQRDLIGETFREEVLTELDDTRAELARLREEEIAALDGQMRLAVRAPMGGRIHELAVNTVGQVVAPGERLVTIVPEGALIVEMRVPPQQVDRVYPGQNARLNFVSLNSRTTPQILGEVIDVSPDASDDERTGETYYVARLAISEAERQRLGTAELRPGMPLEVFAETEPRTILSYMVKPISDQVRHAMRER